MTSALARRARTANMGMRNRPPLTEWVARRIGRLPASRPPDSRPEVRGRPGADDGLARHPLGPHLDDPLPAHPLPTLAAGTRGLRAYPPGRLTPRGPRG